MGRAWLARSGLICLARCSAGDEDDFALEGGDIVSGEKDLGGGGLVMFSFTCIFQRGKPIEIILCRDKGWTGSRT